MGAKMGSNLQCYRRHHLVHSNLAEVELSMIAVATIAAAVRGDGLL
jgi:hypothetical protein